MVNHKQFLISLMLPFTATIIIPSLILFILEKRTLINLLSYNPISLILSLFILGLGLILFINSIIVFYKIGKGTLMPISQIHTQKLVISGPYKYVRNPMIIGVILIILSETLVFSSVPLLIYTLVFFVVNLIYIPLFEEKGMEKRFGQDFLDYKKKVRGWVPCLAPFIPSKKNLNDSLETKDN